MLKILSLSLTCILLLTSSQAPGQIRAGASYLKIMPGPRSQGIAESLAGTVDNMYAIYANPGATGLLREWQWSVAYTNWVPDIYNASFFYGKQLRLPWSRRSRIALGISYLGIKDFDSSKGRAPIASGGDLLVAASYGQPLSAISENLSLGGSIKFLRSRLDNFDANGFIFDAGLLYRTPKFRLLDTGVGLFDEGIISAGVSVTQLGNALHFKNADTPLPRTLRAGMALNMGMHHGLQLHLTGEYRRLRDEDGYFSMGAELSWAQLLTVRGGYSFEKDNLLRHYAAGLSLGLDDLRANLAGLIPGRNNAFQIDFAKLQGNSWFDAPYRGGVSHYPVVPENFEFIEPALGGTVAADSARLSWERSRDPDLYDEVKYWLMVDQDSVKLERALERFDSRLRDDFFAFLDDSRFMVNDTLSQNNFLLSNLLSSSQSFDCREDYYWTVVAIDKDRHYRVVGESGKRIARFRVALPDLKIQITEVYFEEDLSAPPNTYKGVAKIVVTNAGQGAARNVTVAAADSVAILWAATDTALGSTPLPLNPVPGIVAELQPGASDSITVQWQTSIPDTHHVIAWVDKAEKIDECLENNNWAMQRGNIIIPPSPETEEPFALIFFKTAGKDTVQLGEVYEYSLAVKNLGPGSARNLNVMDALPPQVALVDGVSSNQDTLRWTIANLAANADTTISYKVRADSLAFLESPLHLEGVTFEFDSTRLTPAAKSALNKFALVVGRLLKANPKDSLEIGGHTDNVGSEAYNLDLSQRRAEQVKAYLISKNAVFARLIAKGYGESRPLALNVSKTCRAGNRRVEINFPRRTAPIEPMLVNWSQVSVRRDSELIKLVAADTVYVRREPLALPSLAGVNFYSGSANLTPEAKKILDDAASTLRRLLLRDANVLIEIVGHTDDVGSDQSNLKLSQARAESVKKYFIDKCIPLERMRTVGYGERNPIDVNTTLEGRARNRRVELKTVAGSST